MALALQASDELAPLFDAEVQSKVREIYQAVPGSLIQCLEKKQIMKRVTFRQDFSADQVQIGTHKQVNFVDFERALRNTIHESFLHRSVTELRAENISAKISEEYQKQAPSRPNPGESVSKIVNFNEWYQNKEGVFWTNVNANVYIYIEEECENNWFAQDKRKFNYELTIDLTGISVNKDNALKFAQMVKSGTAQKGIDVLREKYAVTWDDV